jgi:hypothetical protein
MLQFMRRCCFAALVAGAWQLFACTAVHAGSVGYSFSFSGDGGLLSGSGTLDAVTTASPGVYQVVSGTLSELAWAGNSAYIATPSDPFNLVSNTGIAATPTDNNSYKYSSDGAFIYDDLLFPDHPVTPAGSASPSTQIDYWGLLFEQTGGAELNLYSESLEGTPYIYWEKSGAHEYVTSLTFTPVTGNTAQGGAGNTTAVPLPGAAGVGFGMLVGLGLIAGARRLVTRSGRHQFGNFAGLTTCIPVLINHT